MSLHAASTEHALQRRGAPIGDADTELWAEAAFEIAGVLRWNCAKQAPGKSRARVSVGGPRPGTTRGTLWHHRDALRSAHRAHRNGAATASLPLFQAKNGTRIVQTRFRGKGVAGVACWLGWCPSVFDACPFSGRLALRAGSGGNRPLGPLCDSAVRARPPRTRNDQTETPARWMGIRGYSRGAGARSRCAHEFGIVRVRERRRNARISVAPSRLPNGCRRGRQRIRTIRATRNNSEQ
jgi:hypothetical protein